MCLLLTRVRSTRDTCIEDELDIDNVTVSYAQRPLKPVVYRGRYSIKDTTISSSSLPLLSRVFCFFVLLPVLLRPTNLLLASSFSRLLLSTQYSLFKWGLGIFFLLYVFTPSCLSAPARAGQ